MTTQISSANIQAGTLGSISGPKVTSIVYVGDDTAADVAGGQTITLNGSGFSAGATILVNGIPVSLVTFVNSNILTFTSPTMAAGGYTIYVINADGGTAISIPGIQYSGIPTWTTSAGLLATVDELTAVNVTLAATGDAPITYGLVSGTLPTGITLNSSTGVISGTAPSVANSSTYTFTLRATDAQNQDTNRIFNLTINPIPVTVSVEYLVVAGGGAGGPTQDTNQYAGGGGAGGLLAGTASVTSGISYTVTVGGGGVSTDIYTSTNGSNSTATFTGEAVGGGGSTAGSNGGSGGGASRYYTGYGRGIYPGSTYISGPRQGYDGGTQVGGGGGAGGPGLPNGHGGAGVTSSISGVSKAYAAGGEVGVYYTVVAAGANTGNGGYGASSGGYGALGNPGGSGVVIIRYADSHPAASTTGSPVITADGAYRVYQFNASGSITF
jgi:hypothetical protein